MKNNINEAPIDYGDRPERMAPDIQAKIQGRETPLSDNPALDIDVDGDGVVSSFEEKLASKRFADVVDKVKQYTGLTDISGQNALMELQMMLGRAVQQVKAIETNNEEYLENLAVDLVKKEMSIPDDAFQYDVELTSGMGQIDTSKMRGQSEEPDEEESRFMDSCLVLHAEHSFNASTFAAREVASTRAHMYAAIGAAVGSLSGELHGGANMRVMEMLTKIGSVDKVEAYVNQQFDAGLKIFGLGHAVYDTDDPRAHILAPMSKRMGERIGDTRWYEMSEMLEKTGKAEFNKRKGRDIYVNVDFYSASLYYAMGIPIDLFTPVFAISRISGWTAHVIEEYFAGAAPKPMLYRPESEYIGDYCGPEVCEFEPLQERG